MQLPTTAGGMNRWGSSGNVPVPRYKPVQKRMALNYLSTPQWFMTHVIRCGVLGYTNFVIF